MTTARGPSEKTLYFNFRSPMATAEGPSKYTCDFHANSPMAITEGHSKHSRKAFKKHWALPLQVAYGYSTRVSKIHFGL